MLRRAYCRAQEVKRENTCRERCWMLLKKKKVRLFGGWSEIRGWLGRGVGVTSHCTGITSFLKRLSSLVVKVREPALSPRCPSQPQGFCSTHGEMLLQRHQGYGRVLSEQHSPEKQVLILTPQGEARAQLSHTCWTSAQTPETWCSATHRATHWVATRFSGPQRANSSRTQLCLYVFPSPEIQPKMSLGIQTRTAADKQSRGRVGGWAGVHGSSSSDGSRTWGLPKVPALGGHASGSPGKVGLGSTFAPAAQWSHEVSQPGARAWTTQELQVSNEGLSATLRQWPCPMDICLGFGSAQVLEKKPLMAGGM